MIELIFIPLLILANGVFAMSEMAIVSARKVRLRQRAKDGDKRARAALELARTPGRFLSTVQVGISLVAVLTGTLGGAAIAGELAARLDDISFLAPYSETISVTIVVLAITYFSLVIGELLPKQLALSNPERIASLVAPPMTLLAKVASPIVYLLNASTKFLMRILRVRPSSDPPVTEDEVRVMIAQGTQIGIFEPIEEEMVGHVFRLSDQRASTLITPRTEITWFDLGDSPKDLRQKLTDSGYSRFPVGRGSLDEVLGLVQARDLLAQSLGGESIDLQAVLRPALCVPESIPVFEVLDRFKQTQSQVAMVIDEYGILQGLVTLDDILEAIVGDIPDPGEILDLEIVEREDGSWLLDGMVPITEFIELFQAKVPPDRREWNCQTLGGFVMMILGHIPSVGERFEWGKLHFEVVDMDGLRVDKVIVVPQGRDKPSS
jgi:putative hemolysin